MLRLKDAVCNLLDVKTCSPLSAYYAETSLNKSLILMQSVTLWASGAFKQQNATLSQPMT